MKYTLKFESQGFNFEHAKLASIAALVVLDEEGNEITRCPECLLFMGEARHDKWYSRQDFTEQVNNGTVRYLWKIDCKPLEDCTIKSTLQEWTTSKLDLKAIMKEYHKRMKACTKLFLESL